MSSKYLLLFVVCLFALSACTNSPSKEAHNISQLEDEVYSAKMLDQQLATHLIDSYINFANKYSADSLAGEYVFKAANMAMNLNNANLAIMYFDRVFTQYPAYVKAPECLFLKAFVCENQLNNLPEAEKYYKKFISDYPNHVLAKDAKAALMYLGKSPEELIQMFQQENN